MNMNVNTPPHPPPPSVYLNEEYTYSESQLGLWHSQYINEEKCSKPPSRINIWVKHMVDIAIAMGTSEV